MNKSKVDEVIYLSKEMLERFWKLDYQFVLDHMADDVILIGRREEQQMQGIEEIRRDFQVASREMESCHLKNQEFRVIHNTGRSCSVAAKYLVTTDKDTGIYLQSWQRCFAIWEEGKAGNFILKGVHVSVPMGEMHLSGDEKFPYTLGRQSYRYLMDEIASEVNTKKFMVTDTRGNIHFIYENEVEVMEAKDHTLLVHISGMKPIEEIMSLTEAVERHPGGFVRVHRSYAVNPVRISHIIGNKLIMASGMEIIIPEKRKTEVIKEIEKHF